MEYVLDSWAFMAHLEGEPSGEKVRELLKSSPLHESRFFVSVVNWGEVLYQTERRYGRQQKEAASNWIHRMGIVIVDADQTVTAQAALYKVPGRIAYADCFAAVLAKLRNATLVTGDKEFKPLEKDIKILWL